MALPCVPRSQPLIYDRGFVASHTTHWIEPNMVEVGYLGVFHVHASNMIGERCAMWNENLQLLLTDCRWITIGDFNMVESPLNRSTWSYSRLMSLKEESACFGIKNNITLKSTLVETTIPTTHGTMYETMVSKFLLNYIDSICFLVRSKILLLLMLCITRSLVIHRFLTIALVFLLNNISNEATY